MFDPNKVGAFHAAQRTVRRAWICGLDPVSGKSFEHRRTWIQNRLQELAASFGIDCLSFAVMVNHVHVILRNRPDVVALWSDEEVAKRWWQMYPLRKNKDKTPAVPTEGELKMLMTPVRSKQLRSRLSDISWWMRSLAEPIARRSNLEDKCTGRFWEGRFKALAITDESGLLACSMYVDLNPIRAAMALTREESLHTSAYDRIQALQGATIPSAAVDLVAIETEEAGRILRTSTPDQLRNRKADVKKRRGNSILRDAWLSPLTINERAATGPQPSDSGVRASNKGFLSLNLAEYLKLLDWTGRQRGSVQKAEIPSDLDPILKRIGIDGRMWCDLVWNFKKYFGRGSVVGSPSSMKESASQRNRNFARGQNAASCCFIG